MPFLPDRADFRAFVILFVAYVAAGYVGLTYAAIGGAASPIWPAAGVGLAGLILGGVQLWPAILLARVAAGLLYGSPLPLWAEFGIGAGNTLAAVAAMTFLKYEPIQRSLEDVRSMLRLGAAAAIAGLIAATVGTLVLSAATEFGSRSAGSVLAYWFVGAFAGAMLVAPLIVAWWTNPKVERPYQLLAMAAVIAALSWLVFAPGHDEWFRYWHILPVLIWVALSFGIRGTSIALCLMSILAVWAVGAGSHAFADSLTAAADRLPMLQQFIAVMAMTALLIAAANAERQKEGLERYRLALDAARQGMFEYSARSGSISMDMQARRLFRLPMEPRFLPLSSAFAGIADDDRQAMLDAFTGVRQNEPGDAINLEFRVTETAGTPRWLALHGRATRDLLDRFDTPTHIRGTVRDITEQKRAEERAATSERFARRVLDNMTAFVGILTPDGTLIEVNRAPLDAAGIDANEVIGKKFWDCIWWSYDPEVQKELQAAISRALEGHLVRYDVPVMTVGGSLLWIDFQIAPLRDDAGRVTHLIPSGADISRRKAMELRKRMMIAILEATPDFIGIINPDGTANYVNPGGRRLLGIPDSVPIEEITIANSHPPEVVERLRTEALMAANKEGVWRSETELLSRTGERIPVSQVVLAHTDQDNKPVYYSTIMRDIREERKAREHEKLLLRELSHRVKNTLAIVQSIVRQTLRLTDDPKRFAAMIEGRISSLGTSHTLLTASNWHGAEIVELLRSQLFPFIGTQDARLQLVGDSVVLPSETATKLGLIIHELGTNAIKHGALSIPSGHIRIAWTVSGERLQVEWIERGGPAIAPTRQKGFGTNLIDVSARNVERRYDPEGLTIKFQFPMPALRYGPEPAARH